MLLRKTEFVIVKFYEMRKFGPVDAFEWNFSNLHSSITILENGMAKSKDETISLNYLSSKLLTLSSLNSDVVKLKSITCKD